jgi:hypothetical protein
MTQKMNPEAKQLWLDELNDPENEQAYRQLRDSNGCLCAMGCLVRAYEKANNVEIPKQGYGNYNATVVTDADIPIWSGLEMRSVTLGPEINYNGELIKVYRLNDDYELTLPQIAKLIKEQL